MSPTFPSPITEAAALSVAGAGLRRYEMGPAVIGAGTDATVVVVASGDNPGVSGVQDSTKVLLRGDAVPALHPRFESGAALPIHLFARLDRGCLPLGTALCRGRSSVPAEFDHAHLELDQPLTREMLDAVRPVPVPGPVPTVDWVDHVKTDPIWALESFVLGWFPAEVTEPAEEEGVADELGDLPLSLAAFHCLARLRPALHRFHNPVLQQPERASGPLGDRLVFAVEAQAGRDWSIPWAPEGTSAADPRVWLTEDPGTADAETILEEEPLSRFLLQFTLYEAMNAAPYHARTYCMATQRLDSLWGTLCPVPLSPFLPTYEADKFFVAPGLLATVSADENEAVVTFASLHRGTLTPLLEHGFRWFFFDG
ncbi:hypothetical protein ACIQGO_37130 [Streptomyces shenzhenensis]|uniref:hypothetical protein n=1 Tax=Streptomyces shenzhenensis TaxID=943815 RepID=UPI00380067BF